MPRTPGSSWRSDKSPAGIFPAWPTGFAKGLHIRMGKKEGTRITPKIQATATTGLKALHREMW